MKSTFPLFQSHGTLVRRATLLTTAMSLLLTPLLFAETVAKPEPASPEPGNPPTEVFAKSNAESEVKLVTERFGRPQPNKLHWSVDPAVCKKFEPTGFGNEIVRCGDYTLLSNEGLYWSCEEDQDTSKDMQASVMLFQGEQRVFVARGYEFSKFNYDAARKVLNFRYWTGVQGADQIVEITMNLSGEKIQIKTRSKSTKDD